ncbi:hypothetical protein H6B07_17025 [Mediterraneibacter glycyrrhizinilyticus]|nr:hypothetical protein [Mediterraneibacter glycyrrhizinilyticus]MBM6804317.1 hypothetical protein [Mediterraneibacter glycyrrhizinilyticus]
MKKKKTVIITIFLLICTGVLCLWYLKQENLIDIGNFGGDPDNSSSNNSVQDENVSEFIQTMKETGQGSVNPAFVTSIGNSISDGQYEYTVLSYDRQKENPGYPYPEGMTPLSEKPGASVDEDGNIMNDFSYLIVNVKVKNLSDEEDINGIWGIFRLKIPGVSSDEYKSELTYLGEEEPRSKDGDYYMEQIPAGGEITMPIIYVIKDDLLDAGYSPYLEINSSGAVITDPDKDVTRYIVLK